MKKRVFYVINLDRTRIMMLLGLFSGFILLAFVTGYTVATRTNLPQISKISIGLPEIPAEGSANATPPSVEADQPPDTGKSIYSREESSVDPARVEPKSATAPLLSEQAGSTLSTVAQPAIKTTGNKHSSPKHGEPVAEKKGPVYALQIASFKTEDQAGKMSANIQKKGFSSYVAKLGNHYVVRVGREISKDEAKKLGEKLKKSGIAWLLVRMN